MDGTNDRPGTIHIPPLPVGAPVIRNNIDASLQAAYHDQRWSTVFSLAKQRYKSTKDTYYAALEIVAKSRSEHPADRLEGRDFVLDLASDPEHIVEDVDHLDLYEFAISVVPSSASKYKYSDTVGVLRSRLVKSKPKDRSTSLRCVNSCIYNSDWHHAQEITVSMEKHFPEEKGFRICNIFATLMYSRSPTCPATSADLLAKIARRKGDKEFESRGLTASADTAPALSLSDQEAWLWLELQTSPQNDPKETIAALHKHALRLVDYGFNDVFILLLQALQRLQAWDELSEISRKILDKAIAVSQREAQIIDDIKAELAQARKEEIKKKRSEKKSGGDNTDSVQDSADNSGEKDEQEEEKERLREVLEDLRAARSDIDLAYLTLGSEPLVWNALINSVSEKENNSQALKQTRKHLEKLNKALNRSGEARDLDNNRYDRAVLRILFLRDAQSAPSEAVSNTRIQRLVDYLVKYHWDVSCFDNAKDFIETLDHEEFRLFLEKLNSEADTAEKVKNSYKAFTLIGTGLKARYLMASSSKNSVNCRCCTRQLRRGDIQDDVCIWCSATIVDIALGRYKHAIYDMDLRQNVLPTANGDPLSDLATVGCLSLLQLARISSSRGYRRNQGSPLFSADIQYVFQAIAWLDSYLTACPKNDSLRMLLIKLYLLIGCVSRAQSLWDKYDVKNAILDSLGPLFFDRISTFAPGVFVNARSNPMNKFIEYYNHAIRRTTPKQIVEAFQNQNWQSIPAMAEFSESLKRSCGLVMAVVEERRGLRLKNGKNADVLDTDPLVCNLRLAHALRDNTDYSYLPNFGGKDSVPTQVLASHGPSLSSTRAHLSLLAERFIDLVSYSQPRDYKPSKPGLVLQHDQHYANDTSINIGRLMEDVFKDSDLTLPEAHYYRTILKLAKLVAEIHTLYCLVPQPAADSRVVTEFVIKDILEELEEQSKNFLAVPENYPSKIRGFHGFVALHAMGMLRESAFAIKLTASYLTAALDKAKAAADKANNKSSHGEMTWATNQLRPLTTNATTAQQNMEGRVKALKELVQGGGWIDRLHTWTFAEGTVYTSLESKEDRARQKEFREVMSASLLEAIGGETAFEDWAGKVVESWQDLLNGWSAVKFS